MIAYAKSTAMAAVLCLSVCASQAKAQTADPKLHPGESVRVTKVNFSNRGIAPAGDSIVNVHIDYIKPDGTPGVLQMNKVKYARADSTPKCK